MINLDLRDLTPELAATAVRDFRGKYSSPCIIGTLMNPKQQLQGDNDSGSNTISDLIRNGVVSFPPDQVDLAKKLQVYFDNHRTDEEYEKILNQVYKLKEQAPV